MTARGGKSLPGSAAAGLLFGLCVAALASAVLVFRGGGGAASGETAETVGP